MGEAQELEQQGEGWKVKLGSLKASVWHWVKVER
jgi:hypothetical protein